MPPKKVAVPDAWDDDWEAQADKFEATTATTLSATEEPVASKAERLAKHAEQQQNLWKSAETPETFHYLAAKQAPPLTTEFKPALKLLSRKPATRTITVQDPVTGLASVKIIDDEEDEDDMKRNVQSAEERRIQAQKEREEKQKKYEEVRARLFGTDNGISTGRGGGSGTSSPGSDTEGRGGRGRGRGRGGRGNGDRRMESKAEGQKELYDPNYTPKPITIQRRADGPASGTSTPRLEEQILRAPRGPDGNGRGGFAFGRGGSAG